MRRCTRGTASRALCGRKYWGRILVRVGVGYEAAARWLGGKYGGGDGQRRSTRRTVRRSTASEQWRTRRTSKVLHSPGRSFDPFRRVNDRGSWPVGLNPNVGFTQTSRIRLRQHNRLRCCGHERQVRPARLRLAPPPLSDRPAAWQTYRLADVHTLRTCISRHSTNLSQHLPQARGVGGEAFVCVTRVLSVNAVDGQLEIVDEGVDGGLLGGGEVLNEV